MKGVFIANTRTSKGSKSSITFDQGGKWMPLEAPAKDLSGDPYCSKEVSVMNNGLFPLPESDSDLDSDPDSKTYGYIVLCRTCFQ